MKRVFTIAALLLTASLSHAQSADSVRTLETSGEQQLADTLIRATTHNVWFYHVSTGRLAIAKSEISIPEAVSVIPNEELWQLSLVSENGDVTCKVQALVLKEGSDQPRLATVSGQPQARAACWKPDWTAPFFEDYLVIK